MRVHRSSAAGSPAGESAGSELHSGIADLDWVPDCPGIYMISNTVTGHCMVGMTTFSLRRRLRQQLRGLRNGVVGNHLLLAATAKHGYAAFNPSVLELLPDVRGARAKWRIRLRELWWANRLGALDERTGYNLEAGGQWSPAARFRSTEAKLLRSGGRAYQLLSGVSLHDAIAPELLDSWLVGANQR